MFKAVSDKEPFIGEATALFWIMQYFPTFWVCGTLQEKKLRHPVANPQQFDDILKMYF